MLKNSSDRPLVSAVIPTRGRPDLLVCAIRSALRQTWRELEVIVVLDGPDEETVRRLAVIPDRRVRTVILPRISGGCAARNAGVRAACGEWIAFLDDDDEWLPGKIELQMDAVAQMHAWFPVITCRLIQQSSTASRVLPPRVYQPAQPVADYLFCRSGLSDPGGLMQTSTLLAARDLLLAIPFRDGLALHQDWDWIIRVAAHDGVVVTMLAKPLSIWRVEDGRATVSRSPGWQQSLAWIRGIRDLVSRRAFSSFVAVQCVWRARTSHAGLLARLGILRAFLFEGRPEWRSLLHFAAFSLVPVRLRLALRHALWSRQPAEEATPGLTLAYSRGPARASLRRTSR
ncbi:MAG TPA: glycosyltransferase family A protein [Acidobacteriaceae bacterium]|jgi:glycosyltransferase involved in cell wall biosynthesis|nr:glycosyltransferase family A protein [Acidobacteriaceae bacterium]